MIVLVESSRRVVLIAIVLEVGKERDGGCLMVFKKEYYIAVFKNGFESAKERF
jgi:hypothetical protein